MPQIHAPPDAPADTDPVKAALGDPEVRRKLHDTALVCLARWKPYANRNALEHDAEDIVSRAQLTALKKAGTFDASRASVKTWTQGIVRNLARKLCGRPNPSDLSAKLDSCADGGESPQDRLIRSVERELVEQALAKLLPAEAELARLQYFEDLSPSEIAGRMGILPNCVRQRSYRIRIRLSALLSPSIRGGQS